MFELLQNVLLFFYLSQVSVNLLIFGILLVKLFGAKGFVIDADLVVRVVDFIMMQLVWIKRLTGDVDEIFNF